MDKRTAIVVALAVSAMCVVSCLAATAEVDARAAAEVEHYQRLWASHEHTANIAGKRAWMCCRPCAQGTVPMMHEAFEGDKLDPPAPTPSAPKKSFLEVASGSGKRKNTYSCCNMCPDLMAPMPRTWNDPSPYSYVPKHLFRFKETRDSAEAEADADADADAEAEESTEVESESETETESESDSEDVSLLELGSNAARRRHKKRGGGGVKSEYRPSNPHHLPAYPYYESTEKAGPPRTHAARDGKFDRPIRPGAAPIWHPPPPPHDDIFRISRSPNLHDGADLKTSFLMPPCCDFCMSTYFPHIINDELQLPKLEPYTMSPVKASLVETAAEATATAQVQVEAESESVAAAAKSDSSKCCHKCIRKDIEDTAWHIYALPDKKKKRRR